MGSGRNTAGGLPARGRTSRASPSTLTRVEPTVYAANDPDQTTDGDEPIRFLYQGAFSYLPNPAAPGRSQGGEGVNKVIHGIRVEAEAGDGESRMEVGVVMDFENRDTAKTTFLSVPANKHSPRRTQMLKAKGDAISPILKSGPGTDDPHGPLTFYNLTLAYDLGRPL